MNLNSSSSSEWRASRLKAIVLRMGAPGILVALSLLLSVLSPQAVYGQG
jgi:hypothetical protein